jgi:transglutaminase-like putative cysteine protease
MNSAPDRQAFYWLYLTAACAAAPVVPQLPLWLTAAFGLSLGWRYASDHRGWRRPGRVLRTLLLALMVVAVYRQYGTVLGRAPGVALLVGLLGLKFLEIRTLRDYLLSLFLFYLALLGAYLQEQALWLGAWTLLTVGVSLVAMIHVVQPHGLDTRAKLKQAGLLVAKALPLMLVAYLLFPRIQGTLWGLPADAHAGLTGLSEVMRPGSINSLSESPEPAFRVTFEGPIPPLRDLYWRSLVLTDTDGQSWSRPHPSADVDESFEGLGEPVRYAVTLEPSDKPWMPALDLPAEVPAEGRARNGYTLEFRMPPRARQTYTLSSYPRYRTPELDPEARVANLQLPEETSPRMRVLAERFRREAAEPLTVARAALTYFRQENFVYTLKPPLLGPDPVDEFLFDTRRGFCEHFAAAFVTLMRAAGVPARIVNGYLGGEVNAAGNYLIVRQSDAHAWAEIWVPERGWVRVDPTGVVAPERVELGSDALRRLAARGVAPGSLPAAAVLKAIELSGLDRVFLYTRLYWDLANLSWYRWVVGYSKQRQERFLEGLGFGAISWEKLLTALGVGTLLIVLAYLAWQWRPRPVRDPVHAAYLRFCRKLARTGLARAPHEGPLDFARRASGARADLAPAIGDITRLYLNLRYGPGELSGERQVLKRAVAAFRV